MQAGINGSRVLSKIDENANSATKRAYVRGTQLFLKWKRNPLSLSLSLHQRHSSQIKLWLVSLVVFKRNPGKCWNSPTDVETDGDAPKRLAWNWRCSNSVRVFLGGCFPLASTLTIVRPDPKWSGGCPPIALPETAASCVRRRAELRAFCQANGGSSTYCYDLWVKAFPCVRVDVIIGHKCWIFSGAFW